jgi:hypothetical protein
VDELTALEERFRAAGEWRWAESAEYSLGTAQRIVRDRVSDEGAHGVDLDT